MPAKQTIVVTTRTRTRSKKSNSKSKSSNKRGNQKKMPFMWEVYVNG